MDEDLSMPKKSSYINYDMSMAQPEVLHWEIIKISSFEATVLAANYVVATLDRYLLFPQVKLFL